MSVKRQATTELNHDNWDQDDPSEHEEMGMFRTASKDVLEKRVIRTAKRRVPTQSGDEAKKSVFSGFGGFNKTQPSSFDFLANLTNGNKATNGTASSKTETPISSSLFSSKPVASNPGPGLFGTNVTSSPGTNSTFGKPTASSSVFGGASSASVESPFGVSKTDKSTTDSPFKVPTSTALNSATDGFKSTTPNSSFGTSTGAKKSPFATNSSNTPFQTSGNFLAKTPENDSEKKNEKQNEEKKMTYYAKLKGLNESVSDWIKKHVEETPLCILTPIFKDYEKHLKEIQEEYKSGEKESKQSSENFSPRKEPSAKSTDTSFFSHTNTKSVFDNHSTNTNEKNTEIAVSTGFSFGVNPKQNTTSNEKPKDPAVSTGFSFGVNAKQNTTTNQKPTEVSPAGFSFEVSTKQNTASNEKPKEPEISTGFSFGVNAKQSTTSGPTTSSGGFLFGINSTPQSTTSTGSSLFSLAPSSGSNGSAAAPFSFSSEKPFSFGSNIAMKPTESANVENDDEDQPPKVEFTPVVEENSVFDKKCKIFVKKDGNFADKGVGTLFIKKIEETGKHQLLVRANTSLGNVLLNLILTSSIPTQRLGKNNVMLVCIPTPDAKPPPTPVLIRVKTSEEADALLETLNKYKV